MFCLRSWLPLLFIPTNASPSFIFLFFVCTYFLNRPCVYCSFLLIILFLTSCNWSDHCFFDFSSNWFQPRPLSDHALISTAYNTTAYNATGACASCAGCQAHGAASAFDGLAGGLGDEIKATVSIVSDMVSSSVPATVHSAGQKLVQTRDEWTGIGLEWLRSLLGRREWRIECLDIYIRL